jgi:hypothetical protein
MCPSAPIRGARYSARMGVGLGGGRGRSLIKRGYRGARQGAIHSSGHSRKGRADFRVANASTRRTDARVACPRCSRTAGCQSHPQPGHRAKETRSSSTQRCRNQQLSRCLPPEVYRARFQSVYRSLKLWTLSSSRECSRQGDGRLSHRGCSGMTTPSSSWRRASRRTGESRSRCVMFMFGSFTGVL